MSKATILATVALLLISGTALAQSNVNVSILYGWNGTHAIPLLTTSDGRLQVDLNTTRSVGLNPRFNDSYDLGTALLRWQDIFLQRADALEYVNTTELQVRSNIILPSNAILSEEINTLTASKVTLGTFGAGNFTFQNNLTVLGNINSTGLLFNNTFYGDVRINGTLYGGSPLKVGGALNVTDSGLFVSGGLNVSGNFVMSGLTTLTGLNVSSLNVSGYSDTLTLNVRNIATFGGINVSSLNISGYSDTLTLTVRNLASIGGLNVSSLNGSGYADVSSLNVRGLSTLLGVNATTALFSGNVGIGTTGPADKLHVNGSGDTRVRISSSSNTDYIGLDIRNSTNAGGGIFYRASDGDRMQFWQGSAERVSILGSGNVGIGTTNPATKFANTAYRHLSVTDGSNDMGDAFSWNVSAGGWAVAISNADTSATSRNGLLLQTASTGTGSYPLAVEVAGSSKFVINGAGNVGIGTTGPSALLDVKGSSTNLVFLNQTTNNANTLSIQTAGTTAPANIKSGSVTIADDSTATIFNTGTPQGMALIWASGGGGVQSTALISYQTGGGTPDIVIVTQGGDFTYAVTTADVTGTTGVDGQITISARASTLEVENRSGATRTITIFNIEG
jgi:hypothetical protein